MTKANWKSTITGGDEPKEGTSTEGFYGKTKSFLSRPGYFNIPYWGYLVFIIVVIVIVVALMGGFLVWAKPSSGAPAELYIPGTPEPVDARERATGMQGGETTGDLLSNRM